MIEEWREFRDGTYEVSTLGNVRRAKPGTATFVGRPLLPTTGPGGYPQVHLHGHTFNARMYVHRVVVECFIGPCPPKYVVNHIDGNRSNNALSNLEYVTARENALHAQANLPRRRGPTKPRAPLKGKQVGDSHWTRRAPDKIARGERMSHKVTTDDVVAIRYLVAIGATQSSVAARFGLSAAQLSRIIRRTRWSHVAPRKLEKMQVPAWL